MASVRPQKPVIAVIGATGTGKSQLAVEIARRYNGEIINADAMQLYEGLPVITNKITPEEMKGVPHHLLGTISHDEDTWTVTEFVKRALAVIDDIHSRDKLPVLVGGTHYYIQSLLFKETLASTTPNPPNEEETEKEPTNDSPYPILSAPTPAILSALRAVDPIMASRWHPNDRRKIQRSLEIYLRTGKPASQTYDEQHQRRAEGTGGAEGAEGSAAAPQERFPALLLWLHAAPDALRARLDARVDKMLAAGLLAEVAALDALQRRREDEGRPVDVARGIWVSIGYKEFAEYQRLLSSGEGDAAVLEKLRVAAVEAVQAATRQYAKRQVRWVRIKLVHAVAGAGATGRLFVLDGSDLGAWEARVEEPAVGVAGRWLRGEELPAPEEVAGEAGEMLAPKRGYDLSGRRDLWGKRACETCGTVAVTEGDWEKHVKSRGHRVREKKRREREAGVRGWPERRGEAARKEEGEKGEGDEGDVEVSMAAFDELVDGREE